MDSDTGSVYIEPMWRNSLLILFGLGSVVNAFGLEPMKHVVRQESFWGNYKHKKLTEKLLSASPEVIDYITQDNIKNGWTNKPRPATLTDAFRADIISALKELPSDIAGKVNDKLTGIVVVNDLGGSAYNEYVLDMNGNHVAGFVILDVSALDKTANQWATWKEQSPFKTDSDIKVTAKIEDSGNDNRKNTIQYILLHEFGHIISIGLETVAPWGIAEEEVGSLDKYAFSALSWKIQGKKFVSVFDGTNFDRSGLSYYRTEEPRLPAGRAPLLYQQFQMTNFPTLYAATNPFDDFAESFVSYVHSVRLKRPWSITISAGDRKIFRYAPCWTEKRCRAKRVLLEKILSQP